MCCIVLHYAALINPLSALSPPLTRKVVTPLQKSGVAWNNQYKTMSLNPKMRKKCYHSAVPNNHYIPCQCIHVNCLLSFSKSQFHCLWFTIGASWFSCWLNLWSGATIPTPSLHPCTPPWCLITHPLLFLTTFALIIFSSHPSPSLSINGNIRIRFHLAWVLYSFSFAFYPVDQANSLCDFDVTKNQIPSLVSISYFTSIANGALLSWDSSRAIPFAFLMTAITDFEVKFNWNLWWLPYYYLNSCLKSAYNSYKSLRVVLFHVLRPLLS